MTYRFGFLMDQIAGHITNYHNLRYAAGFDPSFEATWYELDYHKANGLIERLQRRIPLLPPYYSGILRGSLELEKALLRSRRLDAIWTNSSVGVFFGPQFRRIPTLVDFDSTPLQIDRMELFSVDNHGGLIHDLKFRLFRDLLRSAAILQTWSRWAKQSAIDEYGIPPDQIVINPPGVDLDLWQPATAPSDANEPRRILFIGGDFRRKGGELLLDWYNHARPANHELHIVTREAVEAGPGVHVYRTLQPNSRELRALCQRCHLFVLPSLAECFGIATIEAMAAGLPAIVSAIGGTADIVADGENGAIVPPHDSRAMGEAITAVLSDESRRQAMARRSRELAEERFDLRRNARRTFDLLKEIADRRTGRASAATKATPLERR